MKRLIWKIKYMMQFNHRLGLFRFNKSGWYYAVIALEEEPNAVEEWEPEDLVDEELSYWTD